MGSRCGGGMKVGVLWVVVMVQVSLWMRWWWWLQSRTPLLVVVGPWCDQ